MKSNSTTLKSNITTRQICFILIAYTAVSKLLIYPTELSHICGRDLLFPALVNFLVEGIVIWSVAYMCSKTDKTFFGLLENTFGNIIARIIYGLFALFFFICTVYPVFEQKLYVHAIFYDTVPSLLVFLPFFIFAVYAGGKGFENIGRSADICLPIFLSTIFFIFMMSVNEVHLSNLLPVLKTPVKNLVGGSAGTLFRFAEPCWLLMFMGHFKYKKGDAAKITLSYAAGAVIVIAFLAIFFGIYSGMAEARSFAISKTALFYPAIDTVGKIDLVALYTLEVIMLFAVVINIQLCVYCIKTCIGCGDKRVISLAVNAALILILVLCDNYFNAISELYSKWMWIAAVLFAIVVPLCAWALKRRNAR